MNPRYIVFHNEERDVANAVMFLSNSSHAQLWQYLHQQDNATFAYPISGGSVVYRSKLKKFHAFDSASTLNLVAHESDSEMLHAMLTDNATLRQVVCDFGCAPEFSLVLGPAQVLKDKLFTGNRICGIDQAKYHLHDSAKPIKFGTEHLPTQHVSLPYLHYLEDRLAA